MKRLFNTSNYIFVIALLFSNYAFSQSKLFGTITSEKEPIIGASVWLGNAEIIATSNLSGDYFFENIPNGKYILLVQYTGYEPYLTEVTVMGDTRFDIEISRRLEFDEIVVSALRAGKTTPMTYTNINKETLEKNNLGQDVPYLLKWTPSVVVSSDGGTGIGYTGIRVRGSDPTRMNVTINGIPLNDSESQGTFWVDLPDFVSSTEDIQIQRGVGTSTNGAGAFGASINLNTSKLHEKAYAGVSNSFGSFGTWKSNVTVGSGLLNNRFTFDGRLSHIKTDGYIDRAEANLDSYYLSGAYLGDQTSVRLNVFSGHEVTYQAWNGVPAQYVNHSELRTFNTAGAEKPGEPHDNEVDDYTQSHYQALLNHSYSNALNFSGALHYTKGEGFFEQYKSGQSFEDYGLDNIIFQDTILTQTDLIRRRWLDNDFYGFTYALNYRVPIFDATIGGAWNNYKGKHFGEIIWSEYASNSAQGHRYYDNDAEKSDFNIYGKINSEITNNLFAYLDLQFRQINYSFLGLNEEGANVNQEVSLNFFNPKLGLTYQFSNNAHTYASFAVANREPNRNDYTESSPKSRPLHETLYNTEVGYRQNFTRASFGANFYLMSYDNQLVLTGQINDVGEYTRTNAKNSYRAGLELEGAIEISKGLTFNASATFSQNKIKAFTEYIDNWDTWGQETVEHSNTDLAFSPNLIAGGSLSYEIFPKGKDQQLSFSLSGKYVGEQFIDNTSNKNTTLDPYFFSDLRIGYVIKTDWIEEIGITLLVRNLFDAKYSANAWTYRYRSGWDGRTVDPYTRLEDSATNTYNLTGFYPQAGRNFLLGLSLKF